MNNLPHDRVADSNHDDNQHSLASIRITKKIKEYWVLRVPEETLFVDGGNRSKSRKKTTTLQEKTGEICEKTT